MSEPTFVSPEASTTTPQHKRTLTHSSSSILQKREQLELRYIELLEKRIAVLEQALNEETTSVGAPSSVVSGVSWVLLGCVLAVLTIGKVHDTRVVNPQSANSLPLYGVLEPPELANSREACLTNEQPQVAEGPLSRICFRVRRHNRDGIMEEVPEEPNTALAKEPQSENSAYAFTWLKIMGLDGKYVTTRAQITSPELRKLLWETLKHYRNFFMHGEAIELAALSHPLVHNWTKLTNAVNEECDDDTPQLKMARKDLGCLLERVASLSEMAPILRSIDSRNDLKTVTHEQLWTIFPPGCLVYARPALNKSQVFITQAYEYKSGTSSEDIFVLTCWAYDWNGKTFDRAPYDFEIESYPDTVVVNSLRVYPLEYYSDKKGLNALREVLIKRGQSFHRLCTRQKGAQLFYYDGLAIPDRKGITRPEGSSESDDTNSAVGSVDGSPDATSSKKGLPIKGQVIVDFQSYLMYVPGETKMGTLASEPAWDDCNCASCKSNTALQNELRANYDGVGPDQEFTDEQYLLCPPRVLGYFMQQKMWVQLMVSDVKEVGTQSDDAFKRLVMSPKQKSLIMSLVKNHGKSARDGTGARVKDVVEGKGDGLMILLHGPPGVGKTLTAESVAQAARKPLFVVTVADVGLEPAEVEMNLKKIFDLANAWEAVLLFDEADVFLEARDTNDIKRNALVSVLLRVMEYYDGILILTTNRIKIFDLAVQSRIHLAVKYSELTAEDRRKICLGFFEQLNDDNTADRKRIEEYIIHDFDEEFNGRQIRNVFSSALALAGEKKLTLQDVKAVIQNVRTFQKYLADETAVARRKLE